MRAQTGYLALPPSAGVTNPPQPFELPLIGLLRRPNLPSDVDYRAAVLHMGYQDEGSMGLLALEVPVSALAVRTDTSTHLDSAHVSVLATISDSTGTVTERFSEDIARRWSAAAGVGAAPRFISFERSFSAPPGHYVLGTAILDNNSGKSAVRHQNFEISASKSVPELSDLMVVRGIEPADAESSEPDLLWRGERRVLPNLYGQLPAGAHNVSLFFLAYTDPKSQAPATVTLEVLHGGVALKGQPMTFTLKPGSELNPIVESFAISSAADGEYQIRAILTQDGKTAKTTGAFILTGEEHTTTAALGDAPLTVDPPGLVPTNETVDRPTAEELDRILASAGKNAIEYAHGLPNLICQQTTSRFADARGDGDWRPIDTVVEILTYYNQHETRTAVSGERHHLKEDAEQALDLGMMSKGEFNVDMSNIFKPSSKTEFTWKETSMLRGQPVEVFDYRIDQANSSLELRAPEASAVVGYQGEVYIDRSTDNVKSVTILTDEAPTKFPIRKAAVRVDYDYVAINDHDYLLPVSAQVVAERTGHLLERNDLTFSDFRRFGSTVRILGPEPEKNPQ